MKTKHSLFRLSFALLFTINSFLSFSQSSLTAKDLSTSPIYDGNAVPSAVGFTATYSAITPTITYADGAMKVSCATAQTAYFTATNATTQKFQPTGDYTVEFRVKVPVFSGSGRGFELYLRDGVYVHNFFVVTNERMYFNLTPTVVSYYLDATRYHTYRYAVLRASGQTHCWIDGVYRGLVTTYSATSGAYTLQFGKSSTAPVTDFYLDYLTYDLTGAFKPTATVLEEPALSTKNVATAPSLDGTQLPVNAGWTLPTVAGSTYTVACTDGILNMDCPATTQYLFQSPVVSSPATFSFEFKAKVSATNGRGMDIVIGSQLLCLTNNKLYNNTDGTSIAPLFEFTDTNFHVFRFTGSGTNKYVDVWVDGRYAGVTNVSTATKFQLGKSQTANSATLSIDYATIDIAGSYKPLQTTATDYFRSSASGTYGSNNLWESSSDNTSWTYATSLPTASANSITISKGHLVALDATTTTSNLSVNAGAKLTINTGVTLSTTSFTLESDALNGTATLINNGIVNATTANVQQHLTGKTGPTTTDNWWYVSSPVSGAKSGVFNPAGGSNLFGYYNEATVAYPQITDNNTDLEIGKGYVVKLGGSDAVYNFSGPLNSGEITLYPTCTGTTAPKRGFNLIGNPYPSYINWNSVEKNNVLNTIWYRTRTVGGTMTFDTFDGTIGTDNGKNGEVTKSIPPMQAFWIKVNPNFNTGTLVFRDSIRSHQNQALTTNRLKAPALSERQIIRLKVSNGINGDAAIIVANPDALDEYDSYDSPKISNENNDIPEIYTVTNNENLVINYLNSIVQNKELALGFRPGISTNFTIEANEISNIDSDIKVILVDRLRDKEHELIVGNPYIFTSDDATPTNNRFSILFKSKSGTTDVENADSNGILIYKRPDNRISITYNELLNNHSHVSVYNIMGQKIMQQELTHAITTINKVFNRGVYLVAVSNDKKVFTKKIIVE